MRISLFLLIGLIPAFPLMAQVLSEEPSELNLTIEETPQPVINTNKPASSFSLLKAETPKDAQALQIELDEDSSSGTGTNETGSAAASSEQVLVDKLSFLAGTAMEYSEEGEYEEAERAYLRALKEAPDSAELRFRLSTVYILMNRHAEAVSMLKELLATNPGDAQVHNNLAWCYATGVGVKNKKLALRHAREALLSTPGSPSVWNTLAEAYYVGGDYSNALRSSVRSIELLIRHKQQDSLEDFRAQYIKIQRAIEALELFEGPKEK
jgi:tetratricopeptide (TPR) repeat protein